MALGWRAAAGIGGPLAFMVSWAVLGHRTVGYSSVHEPVSRLAAVGTPTRRLMTAGFVAFGLGAGLAAPTLRPQLRTAARAISTTAAATAATGLVPLGTRFDRHHAVAAGTAYASLAVAPLLGGRALAAEGHGAAGRASLAAGALTGASLAASAMVPRGAGLLQRFGLTLGHAWIIGAVWSRGVGLGPSSLGDALLVGVDQALGDLPHRHVLAL